MLSFDQIIKDIKAQKLSPVYFLHGDEPYYIDQISDNIENNVLSEGEKAFNQVICYGKDVDNKTIVDEARQFPMMSKYRVIIIREAQEFKTLTELSSYIENPSTSTILVICYKHRKLDKRTSFSKLLDKKATVFESARLKENQIADWISKYVHQKGYKVKEEASLLMAEYLGVDLSKITNEVDKLCLNLIDTKEIGIQDIRDSIGISKDYDIFEFQKVLGVKNFEKASLMLNYYVQHQSSTHIIPIISGVYGYFNKVLIAKQYAASSDAELAKLIGGNAFFMKEYRLAASKYSIKHLHLIFVALKEADKRSKGVGTRSTNADAILADLLLAFVYDVELQVNT